MPSYLTSEIDVDISRVLLAHWHSIDSSDDPDMYKSGRNMHGFVCTETGSADYIMTSGKKFLLGENQIAFIPASSAYVIRKHGPEPFNHYTVNFIGDISTLPDWIPRSEITILKPTDFSMYLSRMKELADMWQRMRMGYRMQTKARVISLMADFMTECMLENVDSGDYNRTLPAKRMMDARYAEPLTLGDLAQACNMCEGSFRRAFSNVYNLPPVSYLLNLRVEKAKEFLLLGYTLETTAQMTGFSDVNYFIRYFKKLTGLTPGRFRQIY